MNKKELIRSPLFYVGDKYKILNQILNIFPKNINSFYEPFIGGGSVFLNVDAKNYFLNDIDNYLVNIHKYLIKNSNNKDIFFKNLKEIIFKYGFSRSFLEDIVPKEIKKKYLKTYYAKFNKDAYKKLKEDFNNSDKKSALHLYLLIIYGFNRMLRFNSEGKFNLPVGNVDLNKNVINSLNKYFEISSSKKINLSCYDFKDFINKQIFKKGDFIYFDPPYLITASEYNKLWNKKSDEELFNLIENIDKQNIKFALSNVTHYRGNKNNELIKWSEKFKMINIESNYISFNHNKQKNIKEVLITNV